MRCLKEKKKKRIGCSRKKVEIKQVLHDWEKKKKLISATPKKWLGSTNYW